MTSNGGVKVLAGLMMPAMFVLFLVWAVFGTRLSPSAQTFGAVVFLGLVIAASIVANIRRDRRRDEVQLAADRFGARWALLASVALGLAAVMLPPAHSVLVRIGEHFAKPDVLAVPAPVGLFVWGVTLSVFVQLLAAQVLSAVWAYSKR